MISSLCPPADQGQTPPAISPESGKRITLYFAPEDLDIYDEVVAMAKKCRRNVDQQALYLIEQACTVE